MIPLLCLSTVSLLEGDWILLTSPSVNGKSLLSALKTSDHEYKADEVAKLNKFETHKLKSGAILFYPSTSAERKRHKLQISLISNLKGKIGTWTKTDDLTPEEGKFVEALLHIQTGKSHGVTLMPTINVSIGSHKAQIYQSIKPTYKADVAENPKFYESELSQHYSLATITMNSHFAQQTPVVAHSKIIQEIGIFLEELFKEIDADIDKAVQDSFANNDTFPKEMQDLVNFSGRKVKDLPPDLQRYLRDRSYAGGSGVSLSDIGDSIFTLDGKGYALGVQASFNASGINIFPIKMVGN